jgi:Sensors of blue-light using FAD
MTSTTRKMDALHRMIYFSRARPINTERPETLLQDILDVAERNNSKVGVTGALLFCGEWFLQALEGRYANVTEIYGKIYDDIRHDTVRVISSNPTSARLFGAWSMCGRSLSKRNASIVDVLENKKGFDTTRLTEQSALRVLLLVSSLQTQDV